MTLSRPALIAILGGVLILAVFVLMRATGPADESAVSAPVAPAGQAPAEAPAAEAPAAVAAAPEAAAAEEDAASDEGVPPGLERAVAAGRVAVLAFTQEGGADDAAVRRALDALSGVPVFVDDVRDAGEYQELLGELAIDQAPAIVIVGEDRTARVLQGYVDAGSLAQQVRDAG